MNHRLFSNAVPAGKVESYIYILESMNMKRFLSHLKHYPGTRPQGLGEAQGTMLVKVVIVSAWIRNRNFLNTNKKCYSLCKFALVILGEGEALAAIKPLQRANLNNI
jgi:hypothetical protein